MKPAEIRELTTDDLNDKLTEARTELFNLRFQMATSQLDNTAAREGRQEGHCPYLHRAACTRDSRCSRSDRLRKGAKLK